MVLLKKKHYKSTLCTSTSPTSISKDLSGNLILEYENNGNKKWLFNDPSGSIYCLDDASYNLIDILGETVMYMEVEYYNTYDELTPWPYYDPSYNDTCYPNKNQYEKNSSRAYRVKNNTLCNPKTNKKQGINIPPPLKYVAEQGYGVNSAFAKINLIDIPKTQIFNSINGFLLNLSYYNPPIERISKLKFKFRYHDGTLVDFQNNELNFTIEINQLINEFNKKINISTPQLYNI